MKFVNSDRTALSASGLAAAIGSFVCAAAAIFILSLAFAGEAAADCVCQCVNGELAAICSGNVNVQPVCAPRSCPAPSSSVSMARKLQVSSKGGGSDCAPQQVMDTISGKYEWKVLCR